MKMIEYSSVVFACCVIFSVLYWRVFHFIILKQIRYQLFALRDEARRIAIDKDLAHSECYRHLEKFINKTIAFSPSISLTSFLMFSAKYSKDLEKDQATMDEIKHFVEEAPEEFVKIRDAASKFALVVMSFNSPWMLLFAALAVPLMLAFGKLTRVGLYRKAENYVEKVTPDASDNLQPA